MLLLLPVLVAGSVGCASYTEETREMRSLFRADENQRALELLEGSSIKDKSSNRMLYRLEKAMILDRMGKRKASRKLLLEADTIGDELYTTSVSKTVASFVYNDSATDYGGEDFERVAIHTQLALSFLEDKDYGAARVEAAKINNVLKVINDNYEKGKNKYAEDGFARYMSGIIYEKRGEDDDAIIDYRKALKLFEGEYKTFAGSVPDSMIKALWRLAKKRGRSTLQKELEKDYPSVTREAEAELKLHPRGGEIVVIHEAGHIATKKAKSFVFQVGSQIIRYSWPTYESRYSTVSGSIGVEVRAKSGGSRFHKAEEVQDLNEIAYQTLEDRRGRMIVKETARLLTKGQIAEQARQNFGILGGIAVNVYNLISETADTRSWTLLPQAYYVTRIWVKPGTYSLRIRTNGEKDTVRKVKVDPGEIQIFRSEG